MKYKLLVAALSALTMFGTSAMAAELTRVATVPVGAEITGLFMHGNDLFFNAQHPSDELQNQFSNATVGVIANVNLDAGEHPVPVEQAAKETIASSMGEYQVLFQQGDFDGKMGAIAGKGGLIKVSNDPDFNAYVPTGLNEGYLYTNWEDRPGGMSRVKIRRDGDGRWSADATDADMIDFSQVRGTWVNCFGTLSPWGTPLTSEELYFDNTADWINPEYKYIKNNDDLASYLGEYPNPYDYGFIVEITDPAGTPKPVKHYTMGRYSHENGVVMPDNRTVYLSDDGTGTVFFKFVADKAGDMSAGTLYAAKATQQGPPASDPATTGFDIAWIELAHGTNADIHGWIREYDGKTKADYKEGETQFISDQEIADWAAGNAKDDRVAFLESRKAAVAKGATGEFRKMEGVITNHEAIAKGHPYVYMTMSSIGKTMADTEGDVQLQANTCGVVYQMKLDGAYNVVNMIPVVVGGKRDKNAKPNTCPTDQVANPDNVWMLDDGRLIIGEDTGNHENNMLWVWKP